MVEGGGRILPLTMQAREGSECMNKSLSIFISFFISLFVGSDLGHDNYPPGGGQNVGALRGEDL